MRTLVSLLGVLVLSLSLTSITHAQVVWNGLGGDDNWSTGANWGGTAPANNGTATVQFAGSTRLSPIVDTLDPSWSIVGLAFNPGADSFTLNGNPLTIGGGGITNNSTNPQFVSTSVILGAPQTLSASAGNLTVGGSGSVDNGGFTLTAGAALGKILAFAGDGVLGVGGLTKTGAGSVYIYNTINFGQPIHGAVQVLGGLLSIVGGLNTIGRLTVASAAGFQINTNGPSSAGSLVGGAHSAWAVSWSWAATISAPYFPAQSTIVVPRR